MAKLSPRPLLRRRTMDQVCFPSPSIDAVKPAAVAPCSQNCNAYSQPAMRAMTHFFPCQRQLWRNIQYLRRNS
jgi:hypothetical protein